MLYSINKFNEKVGITQLKVAIRLSIVPITNLEKLP